MKSKILLTVLVVFTIVGVSKAQLRLGPSLIYGTSAISEPGIQVSGYLPIPQVDKLWVGGDLSFYFAHDYGTFKESFWEINANAHYMLYDEKGLSAYGIGGLNLTTIHFKAHANYTGNSSSQTNPGLNLGIGGAKSMNFGLVFAELKYVITNYDHLEIGAGVRFNIKTK